ncbi:MAG: hypothetical protein ACFFDF_08705 [Candidatus Odinarchaeota archaeon]
MNYIKQLNAFYDWRLLNDLSGKEQVLYLTLLHLNNKCGWKNEFNAPNRTLELLCSVDRSALNKLRNNLMQTGLIEYKKGRKGKAGLYKLKCLYMCNNNTGFDTGFDTNLDTHFDTNLDTILKQNKTKQNKRNNNSCKLKFDNESIEYKLSNYLKNWILKNNPNAKVPNTDKKINDWAKHINYMIRLDNRNPEEIKEMIKFCQTDSFWMTNILSTKKLREQYDKLYLLMQNNKITPLRQNNYKTNREKSMDAIQEFLSEMEGE